MLIMVYLSLGRVEMLEFIARIFCKLGLCLNKEEMISDDWTGHECPRCQRRTVVPADKYYA
jgi:hypothetical protein